MKENNNKSVNAVGVAVVTLSLLLLGAALWWPEVAGAAQPVVIIVASFGVSVGVGLILRGRV